MKVKIDFTKIFNEVERMAREIDLKTREIANVCGVSVKQYYKIVKGKSIPRVSVFVNICNYFSVSLDELINVGLDN